MLGAIIGGNLGTVVSQGTQFGIGTAFLRFSREYERQADILGAQLMARAGYDPREMANMFKTIEKEGGSGGPEWLKSHPNPSNRQNAILKEAQSLRVDNPIRDSRGFEQVKTRLRQMSPAPTTEEAVRNAERRRRQYWPNRHQRPLAAMFRSAGSSRPRRGTPPTTKAVSSGSQFLRTGASCRTATR